MADQPEKTWESTILDRHPDIRTAVFGSADFQAWKSTLPSVIVDAVRYYIRGGDMLKDEDQLALEWAYRSGLLPEGSLSYGVQEQEPAEER